MAEFKFLIDTNVVIGLEDAKTIDASVAELVRLCSECGVGIFVDGANYDDVTRDKDPLRRSITLSKLNKFQRLHNLPIYPMGQLVQQFGAINNENDRSDVRLLLALRAKAVDFLVTQDGGLHKRADRVGLGSSVFTVEDALAWLRQNFQKQRSGLPDVTEIKAYQIDRSEPIFASLREDYPGFDLWFDKCCQQHRSCWILRVDEHIAGLVIRKDEAHGDARTIHPGPKILKISTLKVDDKYRGEKFGELLLKQVFWFAQRNKYDLVYLTVLPKHTFLTKLLNYYGFEATRTIERDEIVMERPLLRGTLPAHVGDVLDFDKKFYPRIYDGPDTRKFCVPIQPDYHRRLFPEIAFSADLPLFSSREFDLRLSPGLERKPGNTIRKVYLCRAKITRLRPGDLLFFYMSKDDHYAASQSITTLGIVEQTTQVRDLNDLLRLTAKRSVFAETELSEMIEMSPAPVLAIDFLLIGHTDPSIKLEELLLSGILNKRPPQSICEIDQVRYEKLRSKLVLGFDL